MVDELFRYVEEQLSRGFNPAQVKDALLRNGYSPAIIDGVIESVTMRKAQGGPALIQDAKPFPSAIVAVVVILLLVAGGIAYPFIFKPKEALLDVISYPDREHYRAGENIGFDVQIINMGTKDRFDVTLSYRLFDANDNMVSNKEETLAVSTSTSQHRELKLSPTFRPGNYEMKIIANYEGKVATTSFTVQVDAPKAEAQTGTCFDGQKNQDETNTDCGGVCGGYWYDSSCHDEQRQTNPTPPVTSKATCTDGIRNQDETGIDCGGACGGYWYDLKCNSNPKQAVQDAPRTKSASSQLLDLRLLAKTSPVAAKDGCLEFDDERIRDSCLKSVAQTAMEPSYCELIYSDEERDLCYYPFFMSGDYSVCDKLTVKESLQTCAQLKQIAELQENPPQPPPAESP